MAIGRKNVIKIDPLNYNIGLIGEGGIGKTTIIKEMCEKLAGEDGYLFAECGKEDGADAINGIIFSGKQVVSEADLSELDTRAGKKVRDLVRNTALGVNFAIVGIENQDEMDYEFPIRIMEYDVKRYKK